MKLRNLFANVFDNVIDPFIPAFWARESLIVLVENMVAANLVHRDFEPIVANYGDTINTRKPAELKAYRKTNADSVTVQDVSATNVQVQLNQHIHTSFLIKDGEESKSMISLVNEYLRPAVIAMSRTVDKIVLGQYAQFMDSQAGFALGLSNANGRQYLLDLRQKANVQKIPDDGRILILNNQSETTFLSLDLFTQAQQVGDNGTALRKGALGEKFGFNTYRAYNMPYVASGNTTKVGAINNAAGYGPGATTLTVDTFVAAVATGAWVVVDGAVYRIAGHTETSGATTQIVLHRGLDRAILDNAVVTAYTPAAVNNASGYASGYAKEITIDTTTVAPQVGQLVSFKTTVPDSTNPYAGTSLTSPVYTIIDVNALVGITLDRPLEVSLADNDAVNLGPAAGYNFTFHRNAISLVSRPLALPKQGVGALSAVMNANNLSMRSTITYDGHAQGHLITLDMLLGVKVLDQNLGAVLLG